MVLPLQVEQVWDLVLEVAGEIRQALAGKQGVLKGQRALLQLKRREMKAGLALQVLSRAKELRRLHKISREFSEFVVLAQKKRSKGNIM